MNRSTFLKSIAALAGFLLWPIRSIFGRNGDTSEKRARNGDISVRGLRWYPCPRTISNGPYQFVDPERYGMLVMLEPAGGKVIDRFVMLEMSGRIYDVSFYEDDGRLGWRDTLLCCGGHIGKDGNGDMIFEKFPELSEPFYERGSESGDLRDLIFLNCDLTVHDWTLSIPDDFEPECDIYIPVLKGARGTITFDQIDYGATRALALKTDREIMGMD